MRYLARAAGWVTISLLAGACSTRHGEDPEPGGPADRERRLAAREQLERPMPERAPERVDEAAVGEVPEELMARVRADAAAHAGVEATELEILRAESVVWPDGSLGCPQPGQFYTQAQVPGYWIVLAHAGREFDYRASTRGYFVLCEAGGLEPAPEGNEILR